MPKATVTISSAGAADTVSILGPEARRNLMRTRTAVRMEGKDAVLTVDAADTSAMRAALNSFLECVMVTEDIGRITKGTE